MLQETELFFEHVVREDRSILDFLDADYTFVNERLAKHYGIAGVKGDDFRKVTLPDGRRGGVLTQASILTSPRTRRGPRRSSAASGSWKTSSARRRRRRRPSVAELKEDKKAS